MTNKQVERWHVICKCVYKVNSHSLGILQLTSSCECRGDTSRQVAVATTEMEGRTPPAQQQAVESFIPKLMAVVKAEGLIVPHSVAGQCARQASHRMCVCVYIFVVYFVLLHNAISMV